MPSLNDNDLGGGVRDSGRATGDDGIDIFEWFSDCSDSNVDADS